MHPLSLRVARLSGSFGAEVPQANVTSLTDAALKRILLCLYGQRFVVLRTNGITKAQFAEFARRVGDPIRLSVDTDFPEIAHITNVGIDARARRLGAAHWHTDQSFRNQVSSITMLYSAKAPSHGSETKFCDMAGAYAALPEPTKRRIEDLTVIHRHGVSVAARPGDHVPIPPKGWDQNTTVTHPLVRRHPITDQKTLYAITGTSQGIVVMEQAEAESLLNELCEHAFQDRFVARHKYRVRDLILWDNPTTMHSATPIGAATGPEDTRLLHRISLRGPPSVFRSAENTA
ncbi:MAG: TauD/TfdA family dioxygenase [Gammaproteobacteria bacterium]|nr:TauD/TfdA family dioxygenase [Gammaproteobacteria bacterium]MYF29196.1 TauD/TfdA family dioxygenase [Gammaproteobacteria bacterium]MYK47225.1 TauD/TfdA family dioxygenase [Gammaproteobacteria bacterium]